MAALEDIIREKFPISKEATAYNNKPFVGNIVIEGDDRRTRVKLTLIRGIISEFKQSIGVGYWDNSRIESLAVSFIMIDKLCDSLVARRTFSFVAHDFPEEIIFNNLNPVEIVFISRPVSMLIFREL